MRRAIHAEMTTLIEKIFLEATLTRRFIGACITAQNRRIA
jgi:deoxycytidylate deaminase